MAYTKEQRREYMRQYRAKNGSGVVDAKPTVNIDALKQQIENWNLTQNIKKKELGLLPNIWSAQNIGMFRQRFYGLQGSETGLDQISREQIVRLSRELFYQLPGVGVASDIKAEFAVGDDWEFVCNSVNPKWKAEVEKFINNEWYHNCSTRGFAYDFKTCLRLWSRQLDKDGDLLMLFIQNKQNYPLLQFIMSHRIGSMTANMTGNDGVRVNINGKDYKAFDGVVYDDYWKPLAYTVKRDDAQIATVPQDPLEPNQDTIVLAQNAQLIYKPVEFDKGRGLPAVHASVLYGLQIQDLDNFLMDLAKLEATLAYIVKNDAGQSPLEYERLLDQIQGANNNTQLPAVEPTVHGIQMVKGPTVNYVKSDGGDIESFRSERPSEQIQSYIRTIETKLLSTIGIPHQLIYSPETISGRTVNVVQQLVRKSVDDRQTTLKRYARLAVAYAISVGMEEGYISKNYDENLNDIIDFTMPPEFTLDNNQDNTTNLELYKVGLISGQEYCRLNNYSYEIITESRNKEIDDLLTKVDAAKQKHPNMSEVSILNLYTQRGQSALKIEDAGTNAPEPTTPTQK